MSGQRMSLRGLDLRTKVIVTVVGGALALLGASTYFSFAYWRQEALTVAEQQALLAASAVRGPVESSLQAGQPLQARRSLRQLADNGVIARARIYAPDGRVLLSSAAAEEGQRDRTHWLPRRDMLPPEGVVRYHAEDEAVEAFLPLTVPGAAILEVVFPVGPLREAMDRGLRVGIALLVASLLAMAALLFTMLEREVMAPVRRLSGLFGSEARRLAGEDELGGLASSVAELIEKERAVEELAEVQRRQIAAQAGLAQVGEMAAEMAHEFKRPLASIQTALAMMDQEYALDPRGEHLMGSVRGQLDKLSETMRDLFALARPIEFERESVELRVVMDGALLQLAGHPATQGIEIRREYAEAPPVHGDPRRLEQVVLNLMLNAAEAMPSGGCLTVRLGRSGERVLIEVEDTGVGIPRDAVDKVLLPFYSTKPTGTGLGLALVARIVAAHEGRLEFESEPGQGTVVRVALPVARAENRSPKSEAPWLTHAS